VELAVLEALHVDTTELLPVFFTTNK
jgi:hypothetical protein